MIWYFLLIWVICSLISFIFAVIYNRYIAIYDEDIFDFDTIIIITLFGPISIIAGIVSTIFIIYDYLIDVLNKQGWFIKFVNWTTGKDT